MRRFILLCIFAYNQILCDFKRIEKLKSRNSMQLFPTRPITPITLPHTTTTTTTTTTTSTTTTTTITITTNTTATKSTTTTKDCNPKECSTYYVWGASDCDCYCQMDLYDGRDGILINNKSCRCAKNQHWDYEEWTFR